MGDLDEHPVVEYVGEHPETIIKPACQLLEQDTQNPPGDTKRTIGWLDDQFADLGLTTDQYAVDPAKPNLLASQPGDTDQVLCFLGHVDTVPFEPEAWTHDPLGERDGDRLYGRGATDMKGQIAAMLSTARAYAETNTTPPVTLRYVMVSDEEVGGAAGLPSLLDADRIDADACVIGEPTCEQDRHAVTIADRGSIWLTLAAEGQAAHGSRPMLGVNAIDRLYEAVTIIRERFGTQRLEVDPELEPILEESVAFYEPLMGESEARELFRYPTINLGRIEGGDAINSVPQAARAEIDIRLTAGVETPALLRDIRACADTCEGVTIEEVSWSIGTAEPIDTPLVDAVTTSAEAVTGTRIYRRSATGGGDAKDLRHAGIPTVEFGLGPDTSHTVDEYTTIDALMGNALTYSRIPFAYAT